MWKWWPIWRKNCEKNRENVDFDLTKKFIFLLWKKIMKKSWKCWLWIDEKNMEMLTLIWRKKIVKKCENVNFDLTKKSWKCWLLIDEKNCIFLWKIVKMSTLIWPKNYNFLIFTLKKPRENIDFDLTKKIVFLFFFVNKIMKKSLKCRLRFLTRTFTKNMSKKYSWKCNFFPPHNWF